ncbi:MAG: hypothetical protein ABSF71_20840 [Terriglobia bacterium]
MKNPTVLLIIEDAQDLETYGNFLRDRGYETLMCNSPGEGLNSLETESVSMVIVRQATLTFQGRQVKEGLELNMPPQSTYAFSRGGVV